MTTLLDAPTVALDGFVLPPELEEQPVELLEVPPPAAPPQSRSRLSPEETRVR